ncbi:MAG: hypothetical protein KatS3mg088_459 [Patescibacteria group bacterium]|nr:MAG: hypothetical protein KatS3mg088_459 [Patescibacteria group bacterium]
MRKKQFDIPILFIIFRRKDTALQVIDAIAKVKPKKLYISQDGPRNENEKKEVLETRKAVLSRINWKCDLTLWTHKNNLGLKKHIPQAFDRVFKREKWCIYLEDDTLPSEDFFYFERELLKRYEKDKRIFSINGTNFYPDKVRSKHSYYLSKMGDIWGFGLWRRSWKLYSSNMDDFGIISKTESYKNYFFSKRYRFYLETFWNAIIKGRLDSWAMQLVYAAVKNNMFFITPSVNLVNNLGYSKRSTNISIQKYYCDFGNLFSIDSSIKTGYYKQYDNMYFENMIKGGWLRLFSIRLYLWLPDFFKSLIKQLWAKLFFEIII